MCVALQTRSSVWDSGSERFYVIYFCSAKLSVIKILLAFETENFSIQCATNTLYVRLGVYQLVINFSVFTENLN